MSKATQRPTYRTGGVEIGFTMVDWQWREDVPGTLTAYETIDSDIQVCSIGTGKRISFVLTDEQRVELIHALGGVPLDGTPDRERRIA